MIFDRHEIQPALSYVNSVLCLMRIERVFARNLRYIHADNCLAIVEMSAKNRFRCLLSYFCLRKLWQAEARGENLDEKFTLSLSIVAYVSNNENLLFFFLLFASFINNWTGQVGEICAKIVRTHTVLYEKRHKEQTKN